VPLQVKAARRISLALLGCPRADNLLAPDATETEIADINIGHGQRERRRREGSIQCTTRSDYAGVALVDGEINRFMSFEFVESEDIPTARPTP
jgi:hypothetical protein